MIYLKLFITYLILFLVVVLCVSCGEPLKAVPVVLTSMDTGIVPLVCMDTDTEVFICCNTGEVITDSAYECAP